MKVLITGTTQGIGKGIAELFLKEKHEVIGIDRLESSIKHVNKLIKAAKIDILLDALGPKCFVIMSIHIKDSQEIKIPPSKAIQSNITNVLFANRFIQITLTTNNVTTIVGILCNNIFVSSFSFLIISLKLIIITLK